jgi:hypothetical protein
MTPDRYSEILKNLSARCSSMLHHDELMYVSSVDSFGVRVHIMHHQGNRVVYTEEDFTFEEIGIDPETFFKD